MLYKAAHILLGHLVILWYFLTTGLRSPDLLVIAIIFVLPAKAAIFRVLYLISSHEIGWLPTRRPVHRWLVLVVLLRRLNQFLLYLLVQWLLIHACLLLLHLLLHLHLVMELLVRLFELVVQPAHLELVLIDGGLQRVLNLTLSHGQLHGTDQDTACGHRFWEAGKALGGVKLLLWGVQVPLFAAAWLTRFLRLKLFLDWQLLALGDGRHNRFFAGCPPVYLVWLALQEESGWDGNVKLGWDEWFYLPFLMKNSLFIII